MGCSVKVLTGGGRAGIFDEKSVKEKRRFLLRAKKEM